MIDILYLAYNRLEFTRASLASMKANTDWSQVRRVVIYDDGSTDGTFELVTAFKCPCQVEIINTSLRSPVAIMNRYLQSDPAPIFAKIDSDVMLPAGWLTECLGLMDANPGVDLLGIEAMHETATDGPRSLVPAEFIGGIGLMRSSAFRTLPEPQGRFGFTYWQQISPAKKAWIKPALPVCLLDRMPFAPWSELSRDYIREGWQRPWQAYGAANASLWDWWAK